MFETFGKKEKELVFIVVGLLLVIGVGAYLMGQKNGGVVANGNDPENTDQFVATETKQPVPNGITVPEVGDTNVAANVAVPTSKAPTVANSSLDRREFKITISGNRFSPDTIVAEQKEVIRIAFLAEDKNYDFTQPDYGFNEVQLLMGQERKVEFQLMETGKFIFYCASCGGPDRGPVGYIIVAPKE